MISILYKTKENIVVVLLIYGALVVFLLFYYHQDTKYESCQMENSVAGPILPHTKTAKALWDNNIYALKDG